jgi:hypothetical protein
MPLETEIEKTIEDSINELAFDKMIRRLRSTFSQFPDKRTGLNLVYGIEDVSLGAFSLFFTQSPSFLAFQTAMRKNRGHDNADSLFGVKKIPSDNHIRDILDEVPPSAVFPFFDHVVSNLNTAGLLDPMRSYGDKVLCSLDGTTYFSSKKISCENCSVTNHKNGTKTYSHAAITPVFVKPGCNRVISLVPEFVVPQDGHAKQDCENAAAKRWLKQYGPFLKGLGSTVLGDDLYCKQPVRKAIKDQGLDFILVCKPDSHKTTYEWIAEMDSMGEVETLVTKKWTGKTRLTHTYRYVNDVPLRYGDDALYVNWCEIVTTDAGGRVLYKNSFATTFRIDENNVGAIVADGRARWKVENENNNVLKNNGYNLTHNFGHGKKFLSMTLATLNILAFLFHTVLELTDKKYRALRRSLPSRKTFFDDVRALTRYIYFETWEKLLDFMIRGLEFKYSVPDTS